MPLMLIGLNHKSAPISVREKLAQLCGTKLPEVDGFKLEAVSIFTCNRVEIYYYGNPVSIRNSFINLLEIGNLEYAQFSECFYEYEGEQAINHLFEVVSGLNSMVLGENQILHQVKVSYKYSTEMGYVGKHLHSLFQKSLEVGKKARTETKISENRVSIASTAVKLAKSIFGDLQDSKALIIGAGEMASLVALHLKDNKIGKLMFTNRTIEKSKELALKFNGSCEPVKDLNKIIEQSDIIISSTGAPHPILKFTDMKNIISKRNGNPIFAIDIAVPRDIEEECHEIPNFFLYNIDDLQKVVDEGYDSRRAEAEKVRTIINYESSQFQLSIKAFTVVPMIKQLREQAEAIREKEIASFFTAKSNLDTNTKDAITKLSRQLMAKWLHKQIIGLKRQGSADEKQLTLLADVFGVELSKVSERPLSLLKKKKQEIA